MAFLKRRLKQSGAHQWHSIAAACGIAKTLPRKIAYGDRENPGIQNVQPLLDYYHAQDAAKKRKPRKAAE